MGHEQVSSLTGCSFCKGLIYTVKHKCILSTLVSTFLGVGLHVELFQDIIVKCEG